MTETLRQRLGRVLGGIPTPTVPEPQTRVVSGGTEKNPWARMGLLYTGTWENPMKVQVDRWNALKAWRNIYMRGGPVAECIDVYPLFVLTNGYEFACEEGSEKLKDKVQEWADQPHVDLDAIMWQAILDACICGTAFQEIVPDSGLYNVWSVIPRDASSFWTDYDSYGRIIKYRQITFENGMTKTIQDLDPKIMLTLTIFPVPGEVFGLSLIGRAYDDIMRDLDMIESITKAIHRHGTPKQQWDIGTPEYPATAGDLDATTLMITKIHADTDFVTSATKINMLDTSGITGAQEFSNITLQRMASALGVPEEMLGLGAGRGLGTAATSGVRQRAFMDKISTIQEIVARTFSRNVLDRITGVPGSVWIEFNDPSPDDEAAKATWIAALRSGMDPDAICPADWVREQFGIPPDEDAEKMDDPTRKQPPDQTGLQAWLNKQNPDPNAMPKDATKGAAQ